MNELRLPTGKKLFPFQEEGIRYLLGSTSRALYLADDMGLGKTIQAIVYANTILARRVLIICPAALRLNWLKEIFEWYTLSENTSKCKVISTSKDLESILISNVFSKGNYPSPLIVGYDMLATNQKLMTYLLKRQWDLIILDEAHYIRSVTSKRTKCVLMLWDRLRTLPTGRVLLLSGTPMMNSAADLYPPLSRAVSHPTCKDFTTFVNTYCNVWHGPYGVQYKGVKLKNIGLLRSIMRDSEVRWFLRREKEDVLLDLPDKTFNKIALELDPELEKGVQVDWGKYTPEILKQMIAKEDLGDNKPFATLRRLLGEAKANHKETLEIIESLFCKDRGLVIFFYHKAVRDITQAALRRLGYKAVLHDGSCSAEVKNRSVLSFQSGAADVFLAQVEAAAGYTVTRADTAVFLEWPWLPSQVNQAIDRLHRIGQKNAVTGHFLVSNNELEKKLLGMLITKAKGVEKVMG